MLKVAGYLQENEKAEANDIHHDLEAKYLKTLNHYSPEEISLRLKTYFKFAFVRHPFDRLLSAYRNKFNNTLNDFFPKIYGTKIIRMYRPSADNVSLTTGRNVTFEEFARYAIDTPTYAQNEHWQPYDKLCAFCTIGYDFIGKYETINKDAKFVLNQIGAKNINFPEMSRYLWHIRGSSAPYVKVYENLSRDLTYKLWEKYEKDFLMFRYSFSI